MKQLLLAIGLVAGCALLQPLLADTASQPELDLSFAPGTLVLTPTQLDSTIQVRIVEYHLSGISAVIVCGDSIVWRGAYGFADARQTVPVTDTTLFKLASISKTILTTGILQLWENGLLDLDADVNEYLPFSIRNPYFVDVPITVRMILSHVSSINDVASGYGNTYGVDNPVPLEECLYNRLSESGANYSPTVYLNAQPGTVGKYSNIAFALLGVVMEHVSGMSLEQYFQDSVWTPLDMNETSWFLRYLDTNNIAQPLYYAYSKFNTYGHMGSAIYPAGQVRTSAVQLAHHLSSLLGHGKFKGVHVLDSTSVDSIMSIQFPGTEVFPGTGVELGLGWWHYNWTAGPPWFWGHEGTSIPGTKNFMYCNPTEKTGVIVLTNSSDNIEAIWNIFLLLWDFSRDKDLDGLIAGLDNCPEAFNPGQEDLDLDGYGDGCEPDVDHDGVLTAVDNCPNIVNPGQEDTDHDGIGDACCCVGLTGNVNKGATESPDLSDLSLLISYLTQTPRPILPCPNEANVNSSVALSPDLSDLSLLIAYLTVTPRPALPNCP